MNELLKNFIERKCEEITRRLGIDTTFKIGKNGFCIDSPFFKTSPLLFERINITGNVTFDHSEEIPTVAVHLEYRYQFFKGSMNRCNLGCIRFIVVGGYTTNDIDNEHCIRVSSQDILTV